MTFNVKIHCGSHTRQCPECKAQWGKHACTHRHNLRACRDATHRCRRPKGIRTDHPGTGGCWDHGGNSPSGKRHAQTEAAEKAIAKLGLPAGTADPFTLLSKAVRHSEGYLEAAARVLVDVVDKKPEAVAIGLDVAVEMYVRAIREAARTGKAAVDADVADRMAAVDQRLGEDVHRILTIVLDAAGVTGPARTKAEEVLVRELVAAAPAGDERN